MLHWRLKLSLFLNFFVLAVLLNSVGTVALHVQRTYGVSASSAGLLAACKSLGIVLAALLAVSRLNRVGYRQTMLWALGGQTLVCLLLPSVPGFAVLKLLFVAVGMGYGLIKVSAFATVGLVTTGARQHASFMSFLESFFAAGIVLGYFLFAAFTDDARPESTEWLKVFYLLAALSFGAWLLLFTSQLNESEVQAERAFSWKEEAAALWRLAGTKVVIIFGVCIFLYVMVEQSTMNWLPTYNSKVLNLPARLSIQMASLFAVAMTIGRFSAGFILRRVPWFLVLIVCVLATTAIVVISLSMTGRVVITPITGWTSAPAVAFLLPLVGLFVAPIYPLLNSIILSALPLRDHGAMSGLSVIFSTVGSTVGTVAIGYLFQAYGGQSAVYCSLLPLASLLVGLVFFARRAEPA